MKLFYLASILSIVILGSCSSGEGTKNKSTKEDIKSVENQKVKEITDIDLSEIKKRGVLKALTIHSPSNYFLYKGKSMGFEYELLSDFAEDIGVEFKIVKVSNIDSIISMLMRGDGDLIAHGFTINEERKKLVNFTDHYYLTHQVLVQKKPHNWRQMTVDNIKKTLITDVTELLGETVSIRKETSYYSRVINLIEELGDTIYVDVVPGTYTTEDIIDMVANGDVKYTISDKNIADINKSYYHILDTSTPVSLSQRIAWSVRKSSPDLENSINKWLASIKRSGYYNIVFSKYFKNKKRFKTVMNSDYNSSKTGRISQYDKLIKKYSSKIGWDWRLVSSLVYQESRFDHNNKSWAGANGLMQLMPSTAKELGLKHNTPEENIKAGTKYLNQIFNRFSSITDSVQRIKFTLASYNCGYGHVLDAQSLTLKMGDNSNVWDKNVEKSILKLSRQKYYNRPYINYGYVRGLEPYNYVRDIFVRYDNYKEFVIK